MKTLLLSALAAAALPLAACSTTDDAVERAHEINDERYADSDEREAAADFLVEAANASMMQAAESRAAMRYAQDDEVRDYAGMLVEAEGRLLGEIRALAVRKDVELPERISNDASDELEELSRERGEDFDDEYVERMCESTEEDLECFRDATELEDPEVARFAREQLPDLEDHRDRAKELASYR